MTRKILFVAAFCSVTISVPALAGELNGGGDPNPLKGASICQFSGLNDDPLGEDPENGPGGRTQSYGQDVRNGQFSPTDPNDPHPGVLCNPNNLPIKPIGRP